MLETAIICLALNIYHEARGEPIVGQHAVAQVTMNRAARDPRRVCDVVFKPYQFSWANPLTTAPTPEVRVRRAQRYKPTDKTAWRLAKQIARHTVKGRVTDMTRGAKWYFNPKKANPKWQHSMTVVARIGDHVFLVK